MITSTARTRRPGAAWPLVVATILALSGCARTPVGDPALHGPTNTITWSTASESDNFGFDIYRAEHPEGPFVRITPQPVVGAGTTDLPREYRYVDRDIEAGKGYFYYVESISLSGQRKRFTPVMEAPPKQPPTRTREDG